MVGGLCGSPEQKFYSGRRKTQCRLKYVTTTSSNVSPRKMNRPGMRNSTNTQNHSRISTLCLSIHLPDRHPQAAKTDRLKEALTPRPHPTRDYFETHQMR